MITAITYRLGDVVTNRQADSSVAVAQEVSRELNIQTKEILDPGDNVSKLSHLIESDVESEDIGAQADDETDSDDSSGGYGQETNRDTKDRKILVARGFRKIYGIQASDKGQTAMVTERARIKQKNKKTSSPAEPASQVISEKIFLHGERKHDPSCPCKTVSCKST